MEALLLFKHKSGVEVLVEKTYVQTELRLTVIHMRS